MLDNLFIVQGFHKPLDHIEELLQRGNLVSVPLIFANSNDVDQACPVAFDEGPEQGAVEGNHIISHLVNNDLVILLFHEDEVLLHLVNNLPELLLLVNIV